MYLDYKLKESMNSVILKNSITGNTSTELLKFKDQPDNSDISFSKRKQNSSKGKFYIFQVLEYYILDNNFNRKVKQDLEVNGSSGNFIILKFRIRCPC